MNVIRASAYGLCFGVQDALAIALSRPDAAGITILGELVHNDEVSRRLADRGFTSLPEGAAEPPASGTVMITAHGTSHAARSRLRARGLAVVDATCPLVRRAHDAALDFAAEGRFVVLIGRPGHVEVRGLTGDLERFAVVPSPEDVRVWPSLDLGVVCQTTFPPADAASILERIREVNAGADIRFQDTVCEPTKRRQQALLDLLPRVDAVIVIGGHRSHNTLQLARTCAERGVPAFRVEGPADLDPAALAGFRTVGLTAGTSTLPETIDAVEAVLLAITAPEAAVPMGGPGG